VGLTSSEGVGDEEGVGELDCGVAESLADGDGLSVVLDGEVLLSGAVVGVGAEVRGRELSLGELGSEVLVGRGESVPEESSLGGTRR
jgi:hypothetical protein